MKPANSDWIVHAHPEIELDGVHEVPMSLQDQLPTSRACDGTERGSGHLRQVIDKSSWEWSELPWPIQGASCAACSTMHPDALYQCAVARLGAQGSMQDQLTRWRYMCRQYKQVFTP